MFLMLFQEDFTVHWSSSVSTSRLKRFLSLMLNAFFVSGDASLMASKTFLPWMVVWLACSLRIILTQLILSQLILNSDTVYNWLMWTCGTSIKVNWYKTVETLQLCLRCVPVGEVDIVKLGLVVQKKNSFGKRYEIKWRSFYIIVVSRRALRGKNNDRGLIICMPKDWLHCFGKRLIGLILNNEQGRCS